MRSWANRLRWTRGRGPWYLAAGITSLALIAAVLVTWLSAGPAPRPQAVVVPAARSDAMPGMQMPGMGVAGSDGAAAAGSGTSAGASTSAGGASADGPCTSSRCPIPTPGANELSVAGQLGSTLAAIWATRVDGGTRVRLELLNPNMGPIRETTVIAGSPARRACGPGCWTFTLPGRPAAVSISVRQRGHRYAVRLPLRWQPGRSAAARALLERAVASMASLPGVRDDETMTAGPPGPVERFHYRFGAPDRMAYTMDTGARTTVIGGDEWSYTPGHGWSRSAYGSGRFTTRSWYDWAQYDQSVQLLDRREVDGRRTAEIALMSPSLPVWFRLRLDTSTGRVSRLSMVAGGHFMVDRYSDYGARQRILAPRR